MSGQFLKLEDLLLAPPLAAIVAALMASGLASLGLAAARRLRGPAFEPLDGAAGIMLVLGLAGAAVHALAWAGVLSIWPLRLAAWGIAAIGGLACIRARATLVEMAREAGSRWHALGGLDRTLAALLAAISICLVLAALAPAAETDSLDYHLGVPLDWLRHGGAFPRPDWYAARLVGLGESLNLLGLTGGTDGLGACLQALGGALAALAVTTFCRSDRDRLIAAGLLIGSPVLLFLVPIEKFQLLPAAATTVALALTVRRWGALDLSTLLLACAALGFAASCKQSFLLSGAVVGAAILVSAWRSSKLVLGLACGAGALALLAGPIYARNLAFYGDPLSPFLEHWRVHPDPSLLAFANFERFYSGADPRRLSLPLLALHALVWHSSAEQALGIGLLCLPFAPWREPSARRLLAAAGVAAVLLAGLSRLDPRFFLEPYLWGAVALGAGVPHRAGKWLAAALAGQAVLVAAGAAVGVGVGAGVAAAALFPGTFSRGVRAHQQIIADWMDKELAPGDVVVTTVPSHALFPRPFAAVDPVFFGSPPYGLLPIEAQRARLTELIHRQRATVMAVVEGEVLTPALAELARDAQPIGVPLRFEARRHILRFWEYPRSSAPQQLRLLRLRER